MSAWSEVFLGVIAVATLTMAIGQVVLAVAAGRLARRITHLTDMLEQELKPLFAQMSAIARDASRAAALATVQVERFDRAFGDLVARLESVLNVLQGAASVPLRQGPALLAALRAIFGVVRNARAGRAGRADDEDALFI